MLPDGLQQFFRRRGTAVAQDVDGAAAFAPDGVEIFGRREFTRNLFAPLRRQSQAGIYFERNESADFACLIRSDGEVFVRRSGVFWLDWRKFLTVQQPMIEVSNLTKRYAGRTAVDDISFTVARGEIVGLLGPNGAGKSTTMRVLSGFMPATSGTVRVAGFDVFHDSDEVRRRIGYMPENNPLYPEMRVREYLKFRARLKGLGWRKSRERVTTVMEQCGLTDVGRRIIGQLSKGYKQRVGLADALVHEPELIILDEPTIGLDPHQIRSVRR